MDNIYKILNYPISVGKGIGDIFIGMTSLQFIQQYVRYEYYSSNILKVNAIYPNKYVYVFFDSIDVYIDIELAQVTRIDLYNRFEGKYSNSIGIGSKIEELRNIRNDVYFDEEYILIGKDIEASLFVNDNVQKAITYKTLGSLIIEIIIIEKPIWLESSSFLTNRNRWTDNTVWKLADES